MSTRKYASKLLRVAILVSIISFIVYTIRSTCLLVCNGDVYPMTKRTDRKFVNTTSDSNVDSELHLSSDVRDSLRGEPSFLDSVYGNIELDLGVPVAGQLLHNVSVPHVVYYVWCRPPYFQFQHYVSVLSVIRVLRPDAILFYYEDRPPGDIYYTWFAELQSQYALLTTQRVANGTACVNGQPRNDFILDTMSGIGGIYININVTLAHFILNPRQIDYINGRSDENAASDHILIASAESAGKQRASYRSIQCVRYDQYQGDGVCFVIERELFPKNIWIGDDNYRQIIRYVVYGDTDAASPYDSGQLSPNIAHLIWMGTAPISFKMYLCILSVIYVGQMDVVYIHVDHDIKGIYWEAIKDNPRLTILRRHSHNRYVYGKYIRDVKHWSDVIRLDVLIKYGGLYLDVDAMMVKPLTEVIRSYDAVISLDFPGRPPWPDYINNGVMLGKPNAEFFRRLLQTFKWLNEEIYHWNGLYQPYKILERHPRTALIEPHLQVMCAFQKAYCHPTWIPNHHTRKVNHKTSNSLVHWKEEAFIYHITSENALRSKEDCMTDTELVGEICRYILQTAAESGHVHGNT